LRVSPTSHPPTNSIFTIGHSTQPIEQFLALLRENAIACLADVRRFPGSRRHPQFAREALEVRLRDAGVEYVWLPELGGRRAPRKHSRNTGWRSDGFRGYADYMETEGFQLGITRLRALAQEKPTAFMCAERAWQQCHRGLIADCLKADGWEVVHILGPGRTQSHPFTEPARIVNGRLSYAPDPAQGKLGL
jgi:uncharacterized protein (DUF488 family)